jgi:glycerol kinase
MNLLAIDQGTSATKALVVSTEAEVPVHPAATRGGGASRTLLPDLDRVAWSEEACQAFGVAPEELPAVVGCAEPVGDTTAFGGDPVPVAGLAVDQQAALFAEACLHAG